MVMARDLGLGLIRVETRVIAELSVVSSVRVGLFYVRGCFRGSVFWSRVRVVLRGKDQAVHAPWECLGG